MNFVRDYASMNEALTAADRFLPGDTLPNGATVLLVTSNDLVLAWSARNSEFVSWRIESDGSTHSGHYYGSPASAFGNDPTEVLVKFTERVTGPRSMVPVSPVGSF